ncbi:hypothetical protein J3A83DRAFT_4185842 [Scleroderma citrinum]
MPDVCTLKPGKYSLYARNGTAPVTICDGWLAISDSNPAVFEVIAVDNAPLCSYVLHNGPSGNVLAPPPDYIVFVAGDGMLPSTVFAINSGDGDDVYGLEILQIDTSPTAWTDPGGDLGCACQIKLTALTPDNTYYPTQLFKFVPVNE